MTRWPRYRLGSGSLSSGAMVAGCASANGRTSEIANSRDRGGYAVSLRRRVHFGRLGPVRSGALHTVFRHVAERA